MRIKFYGVFIGLIAARLTQPVSKESKQKTRDTGKEESESPNCYTEGNDIFATRAICPDTQGQGADGIDENKGCSKKANLIDAQTKFLTNNIGGSSEYITV